MSEFHEVGRVDQFRDRRGRAVLVDGVKVAIFRVDDTWHALGDACPHMGASLADGKIVDGCVTCHWHHWKFELESGKTTEREWCTAGVYEIRIEGERVLVRPPKPAADQTSEEEEEDWSIYDVDRYLKPDPESGNGN